MYQVDKAKPTTETDCVAGLAETARNPYHNNNPLTDNFWKKKNHMKSKPITFARVFPCSSMEIDTRKNLGGGVILDFVVHCYIPIICKVAQQQQQHIYGKKRIFWVGGKGKKVM